MEIRAFSIPPSSHFLKSLVNFCLKNLIFEAPEISKIFFIFPTKRACFFFKYYLVEKLEKASFFFPKILSWEEFIQFLYVELTPEPALIFPDSAKILLFLKSLKSESLDKDPLRVFFWASKFLEVFEEFEKEGTIPPNLLYPPEELPTQAKAIFENLSQTYIKFRSLLKEKGIIFSSFLLKEVRELLLAFKNKILEFMEGLYFCGFAALRKAERDIWQILMETLIKANKPCNIFFETNFPPHPLIEETLKDLKINLQPIPKEYLELPPKEPEIFFYPFSDIETEVEKGVELISFSSKPDYLGIVLPQGVTLLPLIQRLEDLEIEINITLPFPTTFLPLNQFILTLLKAQKDRIENQYLSENFFKIIDHPLLKALFKEKAYFFHLLQKLKNFLETKKYLKISKEDIDEILSPIEKEFFDSIYQILFKNWEDLESPDKVKSALNKILEVFKPLFIKNSEEENLYTYLTRFYLSFLEKEVYPLFEISLLWEDLPFSKNKEFYLLFLEYLLNSGELPLMGEPLAGVQILGFLETRLLSFENLIVFDVNERSLPPSSPLNPLLTEEIKRYLGLPVYRNELWDYYFERLIHSSQRVHLFYFKTSKGKTEFFKEPSRFIQKLKWQREKEKKEFREMIFSQRLICPKKLEALPKSEEDQMTILSFLDQGKLSRSFFETYLTCPVKFYFQYLLGLKPQEETLLEDKLLGNFLHKFFETLFSSYLNKPVSFSELLENSLWLSLFKDLWKIFGFEKIFDPLSLWISEQIALSSIKNYFAAISQFEKEGKIQETLILGVEKELFSEVPYNSYNLNLWGRIDFLIRRKEGLTKYYLFDFKANPRKSPAERSLKSLLNLHLPENYDKEALQKVKNSFGQDLTNFQLLFYLYLFLKNRKNLLKEDNFLRVEINAGYLTPSNLEKPEKYLFTNLKPKDYTQFLKFIETDFEMIIIFILNHLLNSEAFYFTEDESNCRYCNYQFPCKNLRNNLRYEGVHYEIKIETHYGSNRNNPLD
jgi:hypothetical protein